MSASILNKILSSPTASTPACNRARDYSKNDDDDDSSSYFQRTVCLFDWWLIKAEQDFHGKRLAVAGFTSRELQAMRVFTSAPIVKRFDVFTLETADGICIILKGFINKSRTIQNGFSYEVFSHFVFGFPTNWEAYTEKLFGKELMTGTGSATFSNVNKSAAVLEFAAVAGLENSVSNATQSKYKKENDRRNHNLENIRDYTESLFERITTNGSKGLESTNLTTEQNNIDNAKNYTSDNLSPLVICVTETVSSLEDDLAVPAEPSNHHVTESSERVANSESNVKCNEGTIRDSRMEEPSNLECTFMNSAMGKSPVPNDSDNLNLSHLDPVVSRGNSGVEWVTISSSLKITAMQKENDQNKDGLNYGKKDCFTACLFQDSETILTCAGEKSSGVENLNLLSSGLKVMPKNLLFTFPIDGNPNVPEVLGNYINDTTRFPVLPSAMNINSTPSRVDTNAIKFTPSNFGGGKGTSSLRNLGNQKRHSEFSGSDKVKSKELMSEVSELLGENLKRCSSQGTIHSERIMDTPEAVRSQSIRRMIRNLLKNSKGKEKEGQTVVCGLKARRRKINSVSVISNQKSNTIQNDILECDNLFNLSDDELEDPTDNTLVKDNSKQRRDRRKISRTGTPRKNVKNFAQRLSGPSDGDCQSDIQTAVGEKEKSAQQLGSSRKKAHRKINFDIHASPLTRERKEKISIISPESLSLKRSRSGRLLLPSLDFWRNQVAVYDADRKITGIQEAVDDVKPSKGSKSEPRIKRRQ